MSRKNLSILPVVLFSFFTTTLFANSNTLIINQALPTVIKSELVDLRGDAIEGGLLLGQTKPGAKVKFQGDRIKVSDKGLFVLGLHRDEKKQAELLITFNKQIEKNILNIKQRKYKIQRINGLPKSKVTPRGKKLIERINNEIKVAKDARKLQDDRLDFTQSFIWPVKGRISGVYGSQRILNGKSRRPHFGVDIARPTGTPIVAPTDGLITMAHPDMFFSGGTIILDHGHGLSSSFLHLSKLLVKVGQQVKQGDIIAEVGATGRVTGPHLDWRMNWHKKRLDPQLLVPAMK